MLLVLSSCDNSNVESGNFIVNGKEFYYNYVPHGCGRDCSLRIEIRPNDMVDSGTTIEEAVDTSWYSDYKVYGKLVFESNEFRVYDFVIEQKYWDDFGSGSYSGQSSFCYSTDYYVEFDLGNEFILKNDFFTNNEGIEELFDVSEDSKVGGCDRDYSTW